MLYVQHWGWGGGGNAVLEKTGKNENRWFVKIVSLWVAFYFHNHGIMFLYNLKKNLC